MLIPSSTDIASPTSPPCSNDAKVIHIVPDRRVGDGISWRNAWIDMDVIDTHVCYELVRVDHVHDLPLWR